VSAPAPIAAPPPIAAPVLPADEEDDLAIAELREELPSKLMPAAPTGDATIPMAPLDLGLDEPAESADLDIPFDPTSLESSVAILASVAIPEPVTENHSTGRERRRYVRMIDSEPTSDSERASLGRISIRKVVALPTEEPRISGLTLGEATRAIRRSHDRDRVVELAMETLFQFSLPCEAAVMLVVRGDAAMSWRGFCRSGASLAEIAVPMDQPGLVPRVIHRNQAARAISSDLGPIDQLLLVSLGQQSGDLAVVPVSIGGQVMCVIAMVIAADASIATGESIAAAAGAAFARLMRNASR
ncbi:MAG: hypothetical protein H0X17_19155, partial [Deltaproteobacteria bacterium]|nr:hypothetical protein [Deltaproteobacteria bacterium]